MAQEITFDTSSGIDLSGWWSNPSTGESYQVVDQFFQDNSLYVKTMQGQIINFNRIQNFVRSDAPIDHPVQKPQMQNSKLLDGLQPDDPNILPEDLELITGRKESRQEYKPVEKEPERSVNALILDKMFSKAPKPTVTLGIKWDWDKMYSTLETLTDTMDVPKEEICAYVYEKYCKDIEAEIKLRIENELFGIAVP